VQLGVRYSNTVGRGETGAAAMTFDLILIGLAIAFDPIPLTTFMIVLPSARGVRNGAAFVAGWLVSLAVVVAATVLATGNNPPRAHTAPASTALAIRIAIGVVLVAAAIRQWRRMRRPKTPKKTPKWQEHVDHMSVWFAMGLAPVVQPWVLIGAGAATVVEARLSNWASDLTLAAFCVLASASYLGLEIYAALRPAQSQASLARFRTWIDSHTDQLIIAGSLIVGFWLIGKSIYLIVA
jgi:Sap, sulfolipid-1-addressing protein